MLPKNDRNDWIRLENPRIRKRATPLHYHLHNFLMWRIPSDNYRIQSPTLSLVGDMIKTKKSAREDITVEGAYFRYIKSKDRYSTPEEAEALESAADDIII